MGSLSWAPPNPNLHGFPKLVTPHPRGQGARAEVVPPLFVAQRTKAAWAGDQAGTSPGTQPCHSAVTSGDRKPPLPPTPGALAHTGLAPGSAETSPSAVPSWGHGHWPAHRPGACSPPARLPAPPRACFLLPVAVPGQSQPLSGLSHLAFPARWAACHY